MREPSIRETAFSCPHCGAYTTQHWYQAYAKYIDEERKIPSIPTKDFVERIRASKDVDEESRQRIIELAQKMLTKAIFPGKGAGSEWVNVLNNLFLSHCYNCSKWAIWVNEDLIYPPNKYGSLPNQDLPPDVLAVVDEARSILDISAKGSAALLRLSIQMLCRHLGEVGENLNDDIANLVKKGLNPIVQKSLDVVRVIGNESVHPGVIDLNDNKDTAIRLFDLINIIADQMITQPKHVSELYEKLPESKRAAIEKRDSMAPKKSK